MKTFYLQVNKEGIITDAIEYPYENYIPYQADSLPIGVYGGWFKLEDGNIVEYPELKPKNKNDEIEALREDMNGAIMELTMLIAMGGM